MDIDIDFANRDDLLSKIDHRVARLTDGTHHRTGVYFTEIPHDPVSNLATIDYKNAEERGYFKIDILNLNLYKDVRDEDHLYTLMNQEPIWELLEHREFVEKLFHLSSHYELVSKLKPKNIQQLAAVLSIIRPAKKYLQDANWDTIMREVWVKPDNGEYYFKHSHSIAYAMTVIVHMNLICEQMMKD